LKVEPIAEKLRRYKSNWLRNVTSLNRMPKIIDQMDEDDLQDFGRDYQTRPKQVNQSLTREG